MRVKDMPDGRAKEEAMMQDPDQWPAWPFLPMKRRRKNGGFPDTGIFFYRSGNQTDSNAEGRIAMFVEDGNLYTLVEDIKKAKPMTIAEILDAGWEVD